MAEKTQESQFPDTPSGQASRWAMEFAAARKELEPWWKDGETTIEKYLGKRRGNWADNMLRRTRWPVFTRNVQLLGAMLFGQTPKSTVTRRFQDAADDVARVAGEMLERLLNTDIERESDGYATALNQGLSDRLLPGLCFVRLRFVVGEYEEVAGKPAIYSEDGTETAPEVPVSTRPKNEDVEIDYVYWRDNLWSPARTHHDVRWWAFRTEMTQEKLVEKFGDIGKQVPLNTKKGPKFDERDARQRDPWSRADVWEIWDKEKKAVYWYVEGFERVLTPVEFQRPPAPPAQPSEPGMPPMEAEATEPQVNPDGSLKDPLGVDGFWPFPRPMMANLTTSAYVPQPDYVLARDLYEEIDLVSTRITKLERAIKAVGAYDKTAGALARVMQEGVDNELIPVENWPMLREKGGLSGVMDMLPLQGIVMALDKLREYRAELMETCDQLTGISDIMRGQAQVAGASATEQAIKARFGSVRIQALQDEFARFASDTLRIKGEIISKHFSVETIIERSNVMRTPDAEFAFAAAQLIKSDIHCYRIEVKPEAVSLRDFAALKSERTEWVTTLAGFLQTAAPMAQQLPGSLPFMLKVLQWAMAGQPGSGQIETVLDAAIQAAEAQAQAQAMQPQGQAQPDPKLLTQQMKGQQEMQKIQAELQADLVRTQAETQADEQRERAQAVWNTRETVMKNALSPKPMPTLPTQRGGL